MPFPDFTDDRIRLSIITGSHRAVGTVIFFHENPPQGSHTESAVSSNCRALFAAMLREAVSE
jgi:hypothetical protein